MATRGTQINSIVKLAKDVAERDLRADAGNNTPEMLAMISAVTNQIKQRAGTDQELKDLVAMIENEISKVSVDKTNNH